MKFMSQLGNRKLFTRKEDEDVLCALDDIRLSCDPSSGKRLTGWKSLYDAAKDAAQSYTDQLDERMVATKLVKGAVAAGAMEEVEGKGATKAGVVRKRKRDRAA